VVGSQDSQAQPNVPCAAADDGDDDPIERVLVDVRRSTAGMVDAVQLLSVGVHTSQHSAEVRRQ
jgi:hypothetical protein